MKVDKTKRQNQLFSTFINLHQHLLDFAMNGVFAHDRVVFFQLHAVGRVFAVFLRHITRGTRQTAGFMLGAFQYDLDAIAFAFLCHCCNFYFLNFTFCGLAVGEVAKVKLKFSE